VTVVFHEWQNIFKDVSRTDIGWREKWGYVFGPPGWSHDGSRLTSEQMRQEEEEGQLPGAVPVLKEETVKAGYSLTDATEKHR
jgi:hypothetical protein